MRRAQVAIIAPLEDVTDIVDPLNDPQREAVTAPPTDLLVLAGAGSGKTRVLVHRIAWLLTVEGVSPHSVMAVTFTNKAAGEMRGRIEQLLDVPVQALWVGTFHGLAHRMLRLHWREAQLPQNFQIIDSDDQQRLVKRVIRALDLDEAQWPPKQAQWFINAQKEKGLRPQHLADTGDWNQAQMLRIYTAYEDHCARTGLVDFAELLLRAHELCRDNPDIQRHYRSRFRHILVDEFQDTNKLQYAWLRVLAGEGATQTGRLFVVGDDDQSIYSWRGAQIENMLRFPKDYPGAQTIKLEQNYRSTGTILKAANQLISRNSGRLGKDLWTDGSDGESIKLYAAFNDYEEVSYVMARIGEWVAGGGRRDDIAILYRSNAQSRLFEESLVQQGIPYRVYGGLRFFERAEVKDALAYLRLVFQRSDDAAFERVINTPTRGIGNTTLERIREAARTLGIPLWDAARQLSNEGLPGRAANAVQGFLTLIENLAEACEDLSLAEQVDQVILYSDLKTHHSKEGGEKAEARRENLDELVNAARGFHVEPFEDEEALPPIAAFLANAALEAGEHQAGAWEDCVQLMTLHSAKGLEFPLVFLVGMEEGLFPHQRSIEDENGLEEERRLCYVGMTRAMQQLHLCYAELRRTYGQETLGRPSRFLGEMPGDCLEEVRPKAQVSRPVWRPGAALATDTTSAEGLKLGQRVAHKKFGEGVVLRFEGDGPRARVQVSFEEAGPKWLVVGFAKLQAI